MENEQLALVTFEQSQRLKMAGFDWLTELYYWKEERELGSDTFHGFQNWNSTNYRYTTSAPTVALALKWMRDVKGIDWQIVWVEIEGVAYAGEIKPLGAEGMVTRVCLESTYESAESALLDELLTLIEK